MSPSRGKIADQPIEVQVAVLFERVENLSDELRRLRNAAWSLVVSIIGAVFVFLLDIAQGWIGGAG